MSNFCSKCGFKQENSNNIFCTNCGARIRRDISNKRNLKSGNFICPFCSKQIPIGIPSCPFCGHVFYNRKDDVPLIISLVVIIMILSSFAFIFVFILMIL